MDAHRKINLQHLEEATSVLACFMKVLLSFLVELELVDLVVLDFVEGG